MATALAIGERDPNDKRIFGIPLSGLLRDSDYLVAVGVVVIIVMMVVPLPTVLLDLLIAANITASLWILLITMFTKNALEFAIFPSLLLIVTLFRLALNISATRLILLQGKSFDGQIILAFGNFVVGGNYVVGIVIFLIIMVIQFIVITRGAGRVAEVAARFTLDSMPGKQMAIDADFNAGVITEDEARTRRRKLQREADFYGAMDGSSKFVQGEAIAGIVITIINILGGFAIGVWQQGLSLADSAQTFTMLTVGDGLVAQIPALLVSTATGIIVTRSAGESTLGGDISHQIFEEGKVLWIASSILLFLGLIPGLPKVAFFSLAGVSATAAYFIGRRKEEEQTAEAAKGAEEEKEKSKRPENVAALLVTDPMEIEIGYGLIPLVDQNQGGTLLERIQMLRRQAALEVGLIVPPIRIRDNMQLKPDQYVVKIKGQEVATGTLMVGHYLAMNPGTVTREVHGIATREPAFGLPALWITEQEREDAEIAGYTVADAGSVIATHVTEVIRKHAHEILGRQEVQTILTTLKASYAELVNEVVSGTGLSTGEFQRVLANLLRGRISIRNMVAVLEALAEAIPEVGKNVDDLTDKVREALKRQITRQFASEEGLISVITLDPELEDVLARSIQKNDRGASFIVVDPAIAQRVWASVDAEVKKMSMHGLTPVLLVPPALRTPLQRFLEKVAPQAAILSYNEVTNDVNLNSVGVVNLGA